MVITLITKENELFAYLCWILLIFGGWDTALTVLAVIIVADYISGMMKGYTKKELDSGVGYKGLFKKAGIFMVNLIAHQLDVLMLNESPMFRTMACWFYTGNEGISILENMAVLGIPLPGGLTEVLTKIKDTKGNITTG